MNTHKNSESTIPLLWIIIGLVLPSIVTWIYFVALSSSPPKIQQSAFALGKCLQFALPIVVYFVWQRHRIVASEQVIVKDDRTAGITVGIVSGLAISGAILALYFLFLLPFGFMDGPRMEAREKLNEIGIDSVWKLLIVAAFYSFFHSGFEEFYWRGFVFRGLTQHTTLTLAIAISSLGFMAHHVLVLARYFGWGSPLTYILSIGVAVGGAIWAVMLLRFDRLTPSWISHAFVDASLFVIAFHLTNETT